MTKINRGTGHVIKSIMRHRLFPCRSLVFIPMLLMAVMGMISTNNAFSQEHYICHYPTRVDSSSCTGITWPTNWSVLSSVYEPVITDAPNNKPELDFAGDSTNPGIYYATGLGNGSDPYIFFRVRMYLSGSVSLSSPTTYADTIFVMFDTDNLATPAPDYAFAWDTQANPPSEHGLEMVHRISGSSTTWSAVQFDDIDGDDKHKLANDINLTGEGYIRTVDHAPCTVTGSPNVCNTYSTFIDYAVKCSYFTRVGIPNLCTQPTRVQVASSLSSNDHVALGSNQGCDIGGGINNDGQTLISGDDYSDANPTRAMVKSFYVCNENGQMSVNWETAAEIGTAGFNVYRYVSGSIDGEKIKLNESLIVRDLFSPRGGSYSVPDPSISPGDQAAYLLEEIELGGAVRTYGPFTVTAGDCLSGKKGDVQKSSGTTGNGKVRKRNSIQTQLLSKTSSNSKSVKIGVKKSGLYRVSATDIASAMGQAPNSIVSLIRNNKFQISHDGEQVGLFPVPDGSAIFFYGESIDSPYTDTNFYWLSRGEATLMPPAAAGSSNGGVSTDHFVDYVHVEKDLIPLPAIFFNPEEDFWLWDYVMAGSPQISTKSFEVQSDGATGTGELAVNLHGLASTGIEGEYSIEVRINDILIGDDKWSGGNAHQTPIPISGPVLIDGKNIIEVTARLEPGVPYSFIAIDSFDLAYERKYEAVSDSLFFRGDGNTEVVISSFSNGPVWLVDLKDPLVPARVDQMQAGGSDGDWWVKLRPASPDGLYLAVTEEGVLEPESIAFADPLKLRSERNGAPYLIITPPDLEEGASELAYYHGVRGLKSFIATTDEIYDAFAWGASSPYAIRDFIAHAVSTWISPPRFVVLLGEGSFDYKNAQGFNDSMVPTFLTGSIYGLFPADNLIADVDSDGVPDIPIGRIPVINEEELNDYIAKLTLFEERINSSAQEAFFVADNPDEAGDFPNDSDDIANILPSWLSTEKLYLSSLSLSEVRSGLLDGILRGATFVNYLGHAGYTQLAGEGILKNSDVNVQTFGNNSPVFLAMTCLAGNFGFPGYDYLGETLIQCPKCGAVGFWGPTSLVENDESKLLNMGFWTQLSSTPGITLGDAVLNSMKNYAELNGVPFVIATYALLGDPATVVGQ